MSELPRPATPGPWEASVPSVAPFDAVIYGQDMPLCGTWVSEDETRSDEQVEKDARAIAALPDWIARADRLEALLREARQEIYDFGMYSGTASILSRIDAELHGGDPTPSADE